MVSRRTLLSQIGVLALGAGGAWYFREKVLWAPPSIAFSAGASTGWLAFEARRGVVILEAAISGIPVRALVDSGAQSSAIDLALAQRLDLPVSAIAPVIAFGVAGQPQVGRAAKIDVQVGGLVLRGLRAAALELGPISTAGVSLILGQDVLSGLIADIDFPNGRIAFRRPDGFEVPVGAIEAPARRRNRQLLTSVMVEALPLEVVVDTGASSALALSSDVAQRAGLSLDQTAVSTSSIVFGGLSQDRMVVAPAVRFAGAVFRDVSVQVFAPEPAGRTPKGLLGTGLLGRFRVILDLGGGRLHLLPATSANAG